MAGYNQKSLVAFLRKNPDAGQAAAADHLDVGVSQLSMMAFCQAQVEAGVWDEISDTAKAIKAARDNDENRWELIAARAGIGVSAVKALYEEAGGSNTGRISKNGNGESKSSKSTKSSKTETKTTRTRGGKEPSGKAAGRRPGGNRSTAPQRARTRAQRMARSGDPS